MWTRIFSLAFLSLCLGARLNDLVVNLPGLPDTPNFLMYSGYLEIPNSLGKQLHYVLVESQNNPATDPLILWLNGGPGCSSMDGLFYEHGPYIFPEGSTTLVRNQYSWNTNASVIYLESPAGVGFSILGQTSNNSTNDEITAHDNVQALIQFFVGFPEYRRHQLYIAGESYAGIYVPTFANNVLLYNQYTPYDDINLVGIMVGNGCTDWNYDSNGALMELAWSHSLIGWTMYNKLMNDCDGFNDFNSEACNNDVDYIQFQMWQNLNIYDIYGTCWSHASAYDDNQKYLRFLKTANPNLKEIPPCAAWVGAYAYLRTPAVRAALNIPTTVQQWMLCSDIDYSSDLLHGSIYVYPNLIRAGLRIMFYSGDVDAAVPFTGSRAWINSLNLGYQQQMTQWYVNDQVAGFYEIYNGLLYVTVKGAGHMVPEFKPAQAHHMVLAFLNNQKL